MQHILNRSMHAIIAAICCVACGATGLAQTSQDNVQNSLAQMHDWVGTSDNGTAWKKFLKSADLEAELAKGTKANAEVVSQIRGLYASQTPGLEHHQFVAVRVALDNWLQELASANPHTILKLAAAEKNNFVAVPKDRIQAAKQQVVEAIDSLDLFVASSGEENRAAWHKYLKTEQLRTQLGSEAPEISKLNEVLSQYSANEVGLELPQFTRVRQSLRNYANALSIFLDPNSKQTYAQALDELTKRLEAFVKNPNSDDGLVIGRQIGWLQRANQAPQVVQAVQSHFWKPNLFVAASSRLVGAGVEDEVSDTSPIQENILGTNIFGTAHTNGRVSLGLIPDSQRATFELRMTGVSQSENVGYNGPVTIYSHGCSNVAASKRVQFDLNGLTSSPASASVQTNSTIDDIAAKCGLIERIAWKKAGKSKGQAEAIASQRAEAKLSSKFDEQASGRLVEANQSFKEKVLDRAHRRDVYPRQAHFSTTSDELHVQLLHVTETQLAAPSAPPSPQTGYDFTLRMHETLVGNYSESIIGGVTLTDERLAKLVEEASGEVPEELKITPDKDPWSVTFSQDQPIAVKLDGNELVLSVHATKFTRGEGDDQREIKNNIRIWSAYSMAKTAKGSKLTRKGNVEVDYVNHTGSLTVAQIAFKTFIRRKFDAMMKPEFESEGIKLKDKWAKAGKLVVQTFKTEKGWVSATWNLVPNEPTPQSKTALIELPSMDFFAALLDLK